MSIVCDGEFPAAAAKPEWVCDGADQLEPVTSDDMVWCLIRSRAGAPVG